MTEQFTYISRILSNGFKFPEFDSEKHERHVYTYITGSVLMLDADNVAFENNEDGIIDNLVTKAQDSWDSFSALMMGLRAA